MSPFVEDETPTLIHASLISGPEISKMKRRRDLSSKASILTETYPNTAFEEIADDWLLKPDSFISHVCGNEILTKLCIGVKETGQSRNTTILMKRTLCVALTELHSKRTSVVDLVSRVCRNKDLYGRSEEDVRKISYENLKTGAKWEQIMGICARANTQNQDENGSNWDFSGILWLFGKGYM